VAAAAAAALRLHWRWRPEQKRENALARRGFISAATSEGDAIDGALAWRPGGNGVWRISSSTTYGGGSESGAKRRSGLPGNRRRRCRISVNDAGDNRAGIRRLRRQHLRRRRKKIVSKKERRQETPQLKYRRRKETKKKRLWLAAVTKMQILEER